MIFTVQNTYMVSLPIKEAIDNKGTFKFISKKNQTRTSDKQQYAKHDIESYTEHHDPP